MVSKQFTLRTLHENLVLKINNKKDWELIFYFSFKISLQTVLKTLWNSSQLTEEFNKLFHMPPWAKSGAMQSPKVEFWMCQLTECGMFLLSNFTWAIWQLWFQKLPMLTRLQIHCSLLAIGMGMKISFYFQTMIMLEKFMSKQDLFVL